MFPVCECHQPLDLLSDLHQVLLQEDTAASGASAGLSSSSTIQPQIPDPLTHSTTCYIQTSSASPHTNHERSPENQLMKDEACVQSTSDQRKLGNWWKKDLETEGASCSLSAATELAAAIESGGNIHYFLYSAHLSLQVMRRATRCLAEPPEQCSWSLAILQLKKTISIIASNALRMNHVYVYCRYTCMSKGALKCSTAGCRYIYRRQGVWAASRGTVKQEVEC